MAHVAEVGKAYGVPVGHPHVNEQNAARVIDEGFRFLMTFPRRDFSALDQGRRLAGR
jgi:4-hydroxy-2-oxoheptanedioate aldolase